MKKFLLIAGLIFTNNIANAQWSELGGTNALSTDSMIISICGDAIGNIYATGVFTNTNGKYYVAKYDGSAWSELGGINALSANDVINSVYSDAAGNIYAAGAFTNTNGNFYVAKYVGNTWIELGGVNALSASGGVGSILSIGSDATGNIYAASYKSVIKYNGSSWNVLSGGASINSFIYSICSDATGNIYSGGAFFTNVNGNKKRYVAKWNGSTWSKLGGTNALFANDDISSVYSDGVGNIYAVGSFTNASGNYYVAKYDGSNWSELGIGVNALSANGLIRTICIDATGNIYVGGQFTNTSGKRYIAKWDGSSWSELGGSNALPANDYFTSICSDAAENIYAAGNFSNASGYKYVAKYTKTYPTIRGYIFTDENSNSIFDGNDTYKANVKVQLSNGNYTFTDNNGFYQIQADSLGSYILTITPSTGFNALPQTVSYNFNKYDTTVTKDIALQQVTTFDSLSVFAVPLVFNAVQGGAMPYYVQYENCGTSVLSPTTYLNYTYYLLNYDSCTDANAIATANGIATAQTNMQPGQINSFTAYYDVKSTANIGDTLKTNYGIALGTNIAASDSFYMLVEGASITNGQRATPSLTAAQVASGKDIYYTINFKNTGTDTAFNIVITDTLSSLLQANTLQMLSSSHKCRTTVKGNVVTLELLNIKLPQASANALHSLGFVSFKVKPQSNLTAGTIITNKANTYYNYRLPISSTATTIIKAVITPVTLKSFTGKLNNNKTVTLNWQVATEINMNKYIVEKSLDANTYNALGSVQAINKDGAVYELKDETPNKGVNYYRLKMIENNGKISYSNIVVVLLEGNSSITVFPNPAKDFVTVNTKGVKHLIITDCFGRTIQQLNNITEHQTINTKQWANGIYIFSFDNGEKIKVVKE